MLETFHRLIIPVPKLRPVAVIFFVRPEQIEAAPVKVATGVLGVSEHAGSLTNLALGLFLLFVADAAEPVVIEQPATPSP